MIKTKIKEMWNNFISILEQIGIYIGIALLSIISFIVATSVIWLPTMLIIFAIKGII